VSTNGHPIPEAAAPAQPAPAKRGMKTRWMIAILVLTFLFVLMPFLFWNATWFGKPLTNDQVSKDLVDTEHPREIQHGLSQIADRILSPDAQTRDSARQFYPEVVKIAQSSTPELRVTAAWVMGQDNTVPEFHTELLELLHDSNPMVRRNAALGLVRFNDVSGRDEIRALLAPYSMPSPFTGTLEERLKPNDEINPGTLLGHIRVNPSDERELRSDVPGSINRWLAPEGSMVTLNQPIVLIDPSPAEVYESLRALYIVGEPQDLPAVEQFVHGGNSVPANVRQQAELTATQLRAKH
jgi:hypothetical protein